MEGKREFVYPAELNALTDKMIQLAADHEKAKSRDVSEGATEARKDQDTDDR